MEHVALINTKPSKETISLLLFSQNSYSNIYISLYIIKDDIGPVSLTSSPTLALCSTMLPSYCSSNVLLPRDICPCCTLHLWGSSPSVGNIHFLNLCIYLNVIVSWHFISTPSHWALTYHLQITCDHFTCCLCAFVLASHPPGVWIPREQDSMAPCCVLALESKPCLEDKPSTNSWEWRKLKGALLLLF
jgi:hypothetical protein